MSDPSIKQKIDYYSFQFKKWKRRINPNKFPTLFKAYDFIMAENTIYAITIITIFLMLYIIAIRIDYLDPKIIPYSEIQNIQTTLLSATAIIVSLLIAFVISKYFDIQRFRTSQLNKFIRLQNRLVQYQRAFYQLGDQLERKYRLHPKYPMDHDKALRDPEYFYNPDEKTRATKPYACIFTSTLKELGYNYSYFEDFDLNRRIMSKPYLNKLEKCLTNLFGTLDRQKHYKYILEDFEVDELFWHSDHFSNIKIAQNTYLVKEYAMKISPKNEQENWENLQFWQYRIDEANLILEKMLKYLKYLHDYNANLIRRFLLPLVIISVFGIILPLLLLSIQFTKDFEYYLTYISIAGFLALFIIIIGYVYSELTSNDIQRL